MLKVNNNIDYLSVLSVLLVTHYKYFISQVSFVFKYKKKMLKFIFLLTQRLIKRDNERVRTLLFIITFGLTI